MKLHLIVHFLSMCVTFCLGKGFIPIGVVMLGNNNKNIPWLVLLIFFSCFSSAKETLYTSVSPEFPNGLHAKYLRYIATKMNMDVVMYPMPYARRIQALKKGDIDIMVGLKGDQPDSTGFYKLQPAYEKLQTIHFIKSDNAHRLVSRSDLSKLVLGMTIDEKQLLDQAEKEFYEIIPVTTLNQKIELLMLGRIDTFLHFEHSARLMIDQKGLSEVIVPAPYQSSGFRNYHVTISTQSPLFLYKEKLERIIREGVQVGDFLHIRHSHYENTKKPSAI